MRKNIKEKWPEYFINFTLLMIGASIAFYSVQWAFEKETDRINKAAKEETERIFEDREDSFKRSFYAIMLENSDVIVSSKQMRKIIKKGDFPAKRFSAQISQSVMNNPALYKYSGNEYIMTLSTFLKKLHSTNLMLDHYYDIFIEDKMLNPYDKEKLLSTLNDLLYFTLLNQFQSQVYVWCYGTDKVYVPQNQDQIVKYLTEKESHSIEELERAQKIASNNKEYYSKFCKERMDEFWEDYKNRQLEGD
jgi:hypothetical protein